MNILWRKAIQFRTISRQIAAVALGLLLAAPAFAQANSPWENAVNVLQTAFTSTIARGLSLVAIVVSGLKFAFWEGGSKRVLAGVLFGVRMAIAAVNFLAWLFPGQSSATGGRAIPENRRINMVHRSHIRLPSRLNVPAPIHIAKKKSFLS